MVQNECLWLNAVNLSLLYGGCSNPCGYKRANAYYLTRCHVTLFDLLWSSVSRQEAQCTVCTRECQLTAGLWTHHSAGIITALLNQNVHNLLPNKHAIFINLLVLSLVPFVSSSKICYLLCFLLFRRYVAVVLIVQVDCHELGRSLIFTTADKRNSTLSFILLTEAVHTMFSIAVIITTVP